MSDYESLSLYLSTTCQRVLYQIKLLTSSKLLYLLSFISSKTLSSTNLSYLVLYSNSNSLSPHVIVNLNLSDQHSCTILFIPEIKHSCLFISMISLWTLLLLSEHQWTTSTNMFQLSWTTSTNMFQLSCQSPKFHKLQQYFLIFLSFNHFTITLINHLLRSWY